MPDNKLHIENGPDASNLVGSEERMIWELLGNINDPEVPVLSILDLGIVRKVEMEEADESGERGVAITITPTYSGCPAMDVIQMRIRMDLLVNGYKRITLKQALKPVWTTDWMTESGKEKLKAYGIAPPSPVPQVCHQELFAANEAIQCPHCNSYHTQRVSEFGSTACKSLYQCHDCLEPFDYFKCH